MRLNSLRSKVKTVFLGLMLVPLLGGALLMAAPQGHFVMPIQGDPVMNPVIQPSLPSILVNKPIFPGLVRPREGDGSPEPDLAESWTVAPDELSWTFKLRQGVTWHDGQPFTADDVVFTFQAIADPKLRTRQRSFYTDVDRVEKVDAHTVRFVLKKPLAPLLAYLGYQTGIVPKHLLDGVDMNKAAAFHKENPVGTGPFKFKEFVPASHVTLVANPDYFRGPPALDAITFKILPNQNAQIAQLRTGEIDFVLIEPPNLPLVQENAALKLNEAPQFGHVYIALNNAHPLFSDPVVRRAMSHGLDKKSIVERVLQGKGQLSTGPIPAVMGWPYDPEVPTYPYDREKAQALLAEAGWQAGSDGVLQKDDQRFAFTMVVDKRNPTRVQIATIAQQFFKQLGMDVKLQTLEWGDMIKNYWRPHKYEAMTFYQIYAPDPDLFGFFHSQYVDKGRNLSRYANPEMGQLLAEARNVSDTAARKALYSKIQRILAEEAAMIYLYYPQELWAIRQEVGYFPNLGIRNVLRHAEKIKK